METGAVQADDEDEFMKLIEQDDGDEDELGALRDVLS